MVTKKHSLISLIVLSLTITLFSDPLMIGGWDWIDQDEVLHEYEIFYSPDGTWDAANNSVVDDWHLATITSEEEQHALIMGLSGYYGEFWLGAQQAKLGSDPENNWEWVTGEKWSYNNWAKGEPNDAHGTNSEQHLAVWSHWGTNNWLWNDEGHLPNMTGFITEKSHSVPEPGSLTLLSIGLFSFFGFIKKRKS